MAIIFFESLQPLNDFQTETKSKNGLYFYFITLFNNLMQNTSDLTPYIPFEMLFFVLTL